MTSPTAAPAAAEVQTLLRFLSQDAHIPLSIALSKINELRKAKLNNAEAISKSTNPDLCAVFSGDEKLAKQVLAAAKRVSNPNSKKRPAASNDHARGVNQSKRARGVRNGDEQSPAELEASLSLPSSPVSVKDLQPITLQTNRAPLLLAFAVTLIRYTMPEQPLSSRLSLAQAVVSANSRSKAQSIGLVDGKSAEDEGWGKGQPRVRIMGREVSVMRRSGYEYDTGASVSEIADRSNDDGIKEEGKQAGKCHAASPVQAGRNSIVPGTPQQEHQELPLWGLDLEALRKTNQPNNNNKNTNGPVLPVSANKQSAHLPIHTPQSAHSYLLKSFTQTKPSSPPPSSAAPPQRSSPTKKRKPASPSEIASERKIALSHLLLALDTLISSWSGTVDRDELDRRAWGWYVCVRPDVEPGERGWGQKGRVDLGAILALSKVAAEHSAVKAGG
jgi:hypothetical protein